MVMYGACKSLAILQQLELPFQVLTSVYHILNYGSSQNRLHFARFVWFLHPCFISLHLFSSPLQCLLASLLSLLYLCCFLFAFSDFFICPPLVFFWMAISPFLFELSLSQRFLVSSGMNGWLLHPSCFLCLLVSLFSPCAFSAIFRRFCHCTEYVPRQTLTSCHDRPICLMALIASPCQYMSSCLACC